MAELATVLNRRQRLNDGEEAGGGSTGRVQIFNPNTAYPSLSRAQIRAIQEKFREFDEDRSGFISFEELKRAFERLGNPKTHLELRALITAVDEDHDGQICLSEFFYLVTGDLELEGVEELAASVNVSEVGVSGGAAFFEAHARRQQNAKAAEEEIKAEQAAKRAEREAAAARRAAFKERRAQFGA